MFTSSQWIARLQRPLLHTFVAVAYAENTPPEQQTIDAGDWIGSATLLGPFTREEYVIEGSGGPSVGGDEEGKWQMTAVYNSPAHRGRGIAKMLVREAMGFAGANGEGRGCRVRIMIHPRNVVVKKLYEGLGFVDAGKCTCKCKFCLIIVRDIGSQDKDKSPDGLKTFLGTGVFGFGYGFRPPFYAFVLSSADYHLVAEAYLSNGDKEMLPEDGGASEPEKYHERQGIIMNRVSTSKC